MIVMYKNKQLRKTLQRLIERAKFVNGTAHYFWIGLLWSISQSFLGSQLFLCP